jgi:hypothetical protein
MPMLNLIFRTFKVVFIRRRYSKARKLLQMKMINKVELETIIATIFLKTLYKRLLQKECLRTGAEGNAWT